MPVDLFEIAFKVFYENLVFIVVDISLSHFLARFVILFDLVRLIHRFYA